jgi:hypothetical protein
MGVWYRHKNALLNVKFWTLENPDLVPFYQDNDGVLDVPFTFGIQISWQRFKLLKYGNNSCITMGSIF